MLVLSLASRKNRGSRPPTSDPAYWLIAVDDVAYVYSIVSGVIVLILATVLFIFWRKKTRNLKKKIGDKKSFWSATAIIVGWCAFGMFWLINRTVWLHNNPLTFWFFVNLIILVLVAIYVPILYWYAVNPRSIRSTRKS